MRNHRPFIFAALAAATLVSGPALADPSTPILYDGALFVTAVTATCPASLGFVPGLGGIATYRPKIAAGDPAEGLAINFFAKAAVLLTATNSAGTLKGASTFAATGISDRAQGYSNGPSGGSSSLAFVPATVTATTLSLTFKGTIRNIYGIPNCVVTVRGALAQRS